MIATVTFNPAVDQTVEIPGRLTPDVVHRSDGASFDAGGKGINVSQYLDALGVDTVAGGLLGGFTGSYISDVLAEDGIDTAFVTVTETTRVNTTILADDEEYKVNQPGPAVENDVVDDVVGLLERHQPETVAVCGSLPPGLDPSSIDAVAEAGEWETAVDVGGDVLGELCAVHGTCKPNREELTAATGMPVETVPACFDAARALREQGFRRVVASLGADGAILVSDESELHVAAIDVDVVDTVGAGDALLAGVLGALDRGESEERALKTGIAVAARVVATAGTSVPSLADVDDGVAAASVVSN